MAAPDNRDIDFTTLDYLAKGNERQRRAYSVLTRYGIMQGLENFDPILVGTIPINIDIESSDLDIACCYSSRNDFASVLHTKFSHFDGFTLCDTTSSRNVVIANFNVDQLEVEIFGQDVPTQQQLAYRHMTIEYDLLQKQGDLFRKQIIELKKQGYKTEPAFGALLGLTGDPYVELLGFENQR